MWCGAGTAEARRRWGVGRRQLYRHNQGWARSYPAVPQTHHHRAAAVLRLAVLCYPPAHGPASPPRPGVTRRGVGGASGDRSDVSEVRQRLEAHQRQLSRWEEAVAAQMEVVTQLQQDPGRRASLAGALGAAGR